MLDNHDTSQFNLVMVLGCSDTGQFTEFAMSQFNGHQNIKHCWTPMRLTRIF